MGMSYEEAFAARLRAVAPEALPSRLHLLPEAAGRSALREILETGCLSQNTANIELARRAIAQVDPDWLAAQLPLTAPFCLFQDPDWQEWEFRRLAEMLPGSLCRRPVSQSLRLAGGVRRDPPQPGGRRGHQRLSGGIEYTAGNCSNPLKKES